jgi:hypothetical protein
MKTFPQPWTVAMLATIFTGCEAVVRLTLTTDKTGLQELLEAKLSPSSVKPSPALAL